MIGTRIRATGICGVLVAVLALSAGCTPGGVKQESATLSRDSGSVASSQQGFGSAGAPAANDGVAPEQSKDAAASTASVDRMIVTNAAMQVRVEDLSASIAAIRSLTASAGGTISQLTVSDNSEAPGEPKPLDATATSGKLVGPANASLTLRIPAKSLPGVQDRIAGLGKLISQSADESDVTQQHIDMKARLENLKAEEVRLRSLLDRAGKVSDLLSVERELSRVRGEIESMSAQLAYLENQAAMATLTVALEQPGPVVRPSAGGWGLVDAVTNGVQGAVLLVRELITAVIALSPLLLIGAVIWWLVARSARKRRLARAAAAAAAQAPSAGDTSYSSPVDPPREATPPHPEQEA